MMWYPRLRQLLWMPGESPAIQTTLASSARMEYWKQRRDCCVCFVVQFNDALSETHYYTGSNERVISEWAGKDVEGSGHGLILCYSARVCLNGLRKSMNYLNRDSRYPGRNLNPETPEYEAGALTTRQRSSVRIVTLWTHFLTCSRNPPFP
jgi:hypothetical protein